MDAQKVSAFIDAALLLFETIADECEEDSEASAVCGHIERHMRDMLGLVNAPSDAEVYTLAPPPMDAFHDVPKYEGLRGMD